MTPAQFIGLAATHFAEARRHALAGLLALSEGGLEPTDVLAGYVEETLLIEEEVIRLADDAGTKSRIPDLIQSKGRAAA